MIGSLRLHLLCMLLLSTLLAPILRGSQATQTVSDPVDTENTRTPTAPPPLPPTPPHVPLRPRTEDDIKRLDAIRYYTAARALESRRQFNQAIELFEKARDLDPNAVSVLRRLSRLYFGMGGNRMRRGVEAGRAAIALDPDDSETIDRLVRYYRSTNQSDEAEALLTSVLEDPKLPAFCPTRLVVLRDLAQLYVDRQRNDLAADQLAKLVDALDSKEATQLNDVEQREILGQDEAATYRRFGELFFSAGRFGLAIKALRRSLIYDPESPETPLYLAQSLIRADRASEALELLEPIVENPPPGRVAFDVLAQVLEALGRGDEIIPQIEAAIEANPENVLLRYSLAERFEQLGMQDRAKEIYSDLAADQPEGRQLATMAQLLQEQEKWPELLQLLSAPQNDGRTRFMIRSRIGIMSNDPDLAETILDAGIELLRANPPQLTARATQVLLEIAGRSGKTDRLITLERLVLEQYPSPQVFQKLASTLEQAGRPLEAAEVLTQMVDDYPEEARTGRQLTIIAELQFDGGAYEQSLESARVALELEPESIDAVLVMGSALQKLGRTDEAIALYDDLPPALLENPFAARFIRIWRANALVEIDRYEEGVAELERLLEEDPDDPWINNDLGYLWAERGENLERAVAMTRKAVKSEPDNPAYRDSLGWALYKLGNLDEALVHLTRAVDLGASATNQDHLGDTYYRLGRVEDARASWSRAAEEAAQSDPPDPRLDSILEKLGALGEPPDDLLDTDPENP